MRVREATAPEEGARHDILSCTSNRLNEVKETNKLRFHQGNTEHATTFSVQNVIITIITIIIIGIIIIIVVDMLSHGSCHHPSTTHLTRQRSDADGAASDPRCVRRGTSNCANWALRNDGRIGQCRRHRVAPRGRRGRGLLTPCRHRHPQAPTLEHTAQLQQPL